MDGLKYIIFLNDLGIIDELTRHKSGISSATQTLIKMPRNEWSPEDA